MIRPADMKARFLEGIGISKMILQADNIMKFKLHAMAAFLLSLAGSCALVQSVEAGGFTYNPGDLMLVFRQPNGNYYLEVDVGPASTYYGAARGSSIPINAYSSTTQLGALFSSLNGLSWSVGGGVSAAAYAQSTTKPENTLWVTDPRSDPNAPAGPWLREGYYTQGPTDQKIVAIFANAQYDANASAPDSVTNTPTAVAISATSGYNAGLLLTSLGNYDGTFLGNGEGLSDVENTTSPAFAGGGSPSRSDLYELQPGSGPGTYLGYFELDPNGSMTFFAQTYPTPSVSVSADGAGDVFVSFPSSANGTYSLHYTNSAGLTAPVETWSTVSTNIIGDGTVKSFQQTASGTSAFYSVSVH